MKRQCMDCEWRRPFDGDGMTRDNFQTFAYCPYKKVVTKTSVIYERCPVDGKCRNGLEAESVG